MHCSRKRSPPGPFVEWIGVTESTKSSSLCKRCLLLCQSSQLRRRHNPQYDEFWVFIENMLHKFCQLPFHFKLLLGKDRSHWPTRRQQTLVYQGQLLPTSTRSWVQKGHPRWVLPWKTVGLTPQELWDATASPWLCRTNAKNRNMPSQHGSRGVKSRKLGK